MNKPNKSLLLLLLLVISSHLHQSLIAQVTWTQKAHEPGMLSVNTTCFAIGADVFYCTGRTSLGWSSKCCQTVWKFNTLTNTWTQMNDFPGPERMNAVSFVVNGKVYITTGYSLDTLYHYHKDLWEYNPATDSWTQKANFPGAAIYEGVSFAIGNYGYVGSGIDSSFNRYNQFYKYDPASNTWSSVADLPTTARYEAFAAASATKGYVGLGHSIYDNFYPKDLWEYNPSTNTWLALPDLDTTKVFASACVIQNKLYILGGRVFPYVGDSSGSADVIKFDLNTHTWQYINAPNIKRIGGGAAVVNNKGYIGLGWNGSFALWTDLWEFSPSGSSSVSNVEENESIATLYPVPAKQYLHIHSDHNLQGGHIAFYNMQGSCVKQITIPSSGSEVNVSLDHLGTGLYTYSISSTDGKKQHGMISIQE